MRLLSLSLRLKDLLGPVTRVKKRDTSGCSRGNDSGGGAASLSLAHPRTLSGTLSHTLWHTLSHEVHMRTGTAREEGLGFRVARLE